MGKWRPRHSLTIRDVYFFNARCKRQRLPKFHTISLWIRNPGEASVIVVFAARIDGNALSLQLLKQHIKVIDAVVNHRLLLTAFVTDAEI